MKFALRIILFMIIALSFLVGCTSTDPNAEMEKQIDESNTMIKGDHVPSTFHGASYVPIYSEIYTKTKDQTILLTATLSIRNTSRKDSLFISAVDYYDSSGERVRSYIDETIFLRPLESIDYIIDESDDLGGSGANFIVEWSAKKDIEPLFQGVMLGLIGPSAFSYTTEAVAIE